MRIIFWFRQDLRLHDNPGLYKASQEGEVIPIYIYQPPKESSRSLGSASRWWLHYSLESLQVSLRSKGNALVLRQGDPLVILKNIVQETDAAAIYWSRLYDSDSLSLEQSVSDYFRTQGVVVKSFNSHLLYEPWELKTKSGSHYQIYTAFWKAFNLGGTMFEIMPEPISFASQLQIQSDSLESLSLLPSLPDWAGGLREIWQPGEKGAKERLRTFLDHQLSTYNYGRDRPDLEGTSRLSPHLRWGEISSRSVWKEITNTQLLKDINFSAIETFLKELVWREFSYHTLYHFPDLPYQPMKPVFSSFNWQDDKKVLRSWQMGKTGYPIVDAGMRQLWQTGWMHNRVRMIVGSFLVKDLLIPWQQGESWFWDTLVDADPAQNTFNWQWIAGCGADAAPYFRIFNPILQGQKFDPEGSYVRRWVPELKHFLKEYIHTPWLAKKADLDCSYPDPIVDHSFARRRALNSYRELHAKNSYFS